MRANVNESCIGCGLCVETCPVVFRMEEGLAQGQEIPDNQLSCAQEAAENCPVGAIELEND